MSTLSRPISTPRQSAGQKWFLSNVVLLVLVVIVAALLIADLTLLKPRKDYYAQAKPRPDDVLLIVEVADSSIDYDRHVKVPLYARALIPVVWLVDLSAGTVEVYSRPAPGADQSLETVGRGDRLTLDAFPDLAFVVAEILG